MSTIGLRFVDRATTVVGMIERIRTIATAAVTWLTVAGAVAAVAVDELAAWPAAADIASRVAIVVATATAIIRRVTPVPADQRGLV